MPAPRWRDLRSFIFDMDGVIYRGAAVLPGAPEFVAALRNARVPFLFLTNNSTTPPDKVAERLGQMGIPASARRSSDLRAGDCRSPRCRIARRTRYRHRRDGHRERPD